MTFRAFVAGVLLAVVVAGGARRAHAADADATVQVLDARGRPLAGAVLVRPAAERGALVLTGGEEEIARANADGRLVMRGELADQARGGAFVWTAPRHAPARWRATASGSDLVRLLPAVAVGGRLTRDGVTLSGAVVEARAVPFLSGIAHRARTDENGRYELDRLHAGVWRLSFLRADGRWQTIGLARPGEAADFEITSSAELVALLLPDHDEDGPVRGVRLALVARDGSGAVSTGLSDDEGRVLVSRLDEGAYDVQLQDERWIWSGPPPRIVIDRPGRALSATWVVVPRRTYRGRVVDHDDKPVSGARVEVVDAGADPAPDDPLRARATRARMAGSCSRASVPTAPSACSSSRRRPPRGWGRSRTAPTMRTTTWATSAWIAARRSGSVPPALTAAHRRGSWSRSHPATAGRPLARARSRAFARRRSQTRTARHASRPCRWPISSWSRVPKAGAPRG